MDVDLIFKIDELGNFVAVLNHHQLRSRHEQQPMMNTLACAMSTLSK